MLIKTLSLFSKSLLPLILVMCLSEYQFGCPSLSVVSCYSGFPFIFFVIIMSELENLVGLLDSEFPNISWLLLLCAWLFGRPCAMLSSGYKLKMNRKRMARNQMTSILTGRQLSVLCWNGMQSVFLCS